MNNTIVTLVGHVISEVRYATTAGGVPVASFRLAATDRRYDRQRQVWVDGDSSFFTVWSWRWLAENVLGSVGRGDPLLVTGRMRIREWGDGDTNSRGIAAEIEATAIGHDLSRGTSAFRRGARGRPELVAKASARAAAADARQADARQGLSGSPESLGSSLGSSGSLSGSDGKSPGRAGGTVLPDPTPGEVPGAAPRPGQRTAQQPAAPLPALVGAAAGPAASLDPSPAVSRSTDPAPSPPATTCAPSVRTSNRSD
jgi:single-strand DNA-binding protein